ncbi:hypothetical protein SDC9_169487 [bioreactor metagenome]|uniref:Uncharacterized protein n=1 Tax=bioreactor metagenome TaxID=1076179 RepID=A0A645GDL1_9ZZZZ
MRKQEDNTYQGILFIKEMLRYGAGAVTKFIDILTELSSKIIYKSWLKISS